MLYSYHPGNISINCGRVIKVWKGCLWRNWSYDKANNNYPQISTITILVVLFKKYFNCGKLTPTCGRVYWLFKVLEITLHLEGPTIFPFFSFMYLFVTYLLRIPHIKKNYNRCVALPSAWVFSRVEPSSILPHFWLRGGWIPYTRYMK